MPAGAASGAARRRGCPWRGLAAGLPLLAVPVRSQGNLRCWGGPFNYDFCCNASLPEGNPDCWDKTRYTHKRCCLSPDEPLPPLHPVNPRASKKWRIVSGKDLGGWMIHELVFFSDPACKQRVRKHLRPISSGHRKGFQPAHAFDQWVKATDEYFWYSEAAKAGEAWLGLELVRPVEVQCVGLWHNNIPAVPVSLQRWDATGERWLDVRHWPKAPGGEWALLPIQGEAQLASEPAGGEL